MSINRNAEDKSATFVAIGVAVSSGIAVIRTDALEEAVNSFNTLDFFSSRICMINVYVFGFCKIGRTTVKRNIIRKIRVIVDMIFD